MLGAWGVGCRDCGLLKCKLGLGGGRRSGTARGCQYCMAGPCILLGHGMPASAVWRGPSACRPRGPAPRPQFDPLLAHHVVSGRSAQTHRLPDTPVPHTHSQSSRISSLSCFGISSALSQPHSRTLYLGPKLPVCTGSVTLVIQKRVYVSVCHTVMGFLKFYLFKVELTY